MKSFLKALTWKSLFLSKPEFGSIKIIQPYPDPLDINPPKHLKSLTRNCINKSSDNRIVEFKRTVLFNSIRNSKRRNKGNFTSKSN